MPALCHADYTYGNDYDEDGKMVYGKGASDFFHWDKRDYTFLYPPKDIPMPPPEVLVQAAAFICTVHHAQWGPSASGLLHEALP